MCTITLPEGVIALKQICEKERKKKRKKENTKERKKEKTRRVCETRMPPAATKSKYGKNL